MPNNPLIHIAKKKKSHYFSLFVLHCVLQKCIGGVKQRKCPLNL